MIQKYRTKIQLSSFWTSHAVGCWKDLTIVLNLRNMISHTVPYQASIAESVSTSQILTGNTGLKQVSYPYASFIGHFCLDNFIFCMDEPERSVFFKSGRCSRYDTNWWLTVWDDAQVALFSTPSGRLSRGSEPICINCHSLFPPCFFLFNLLDFFVASVLNSLNCRYFMIFHDVSRDSTYFYQTDANILTLYACMPCKLGPSRNSSVKKPVTSSPLPPLLKGDIMEADWLKWFDAATLLGN